jgi:acetyltransferase-like isoleucine patch superfamily enzyme
MFLGTGYWPDSCLPGFGFRRLGRGVKIKRSVVITETENLSIGDHVRIDDDVVIVCNGEPCQIGSHVHIASHCVFLGRAGFTLADFVSISPHCVIVTLSDDYTGEKLTNPTVPRQLTGGPEGRVILGRHVILGTRTTVMPGVTVAEGCAISAHSLIHTGETTDPWGRYFGVPARRIGPRKMDLLELERLVPP